MSEMADAFWATIKRPVCRGCGNENWTAMRSVVSDEGGMIDECDRCGSFQAGTVPDVFFNQPYYSKALDVEFTSKAQKAAYLKEHGLSEAGDMKFGKQSWVDGTRAHRRAQFEKDRPMIREVYRQYLANRRRNG